MNTTRLPQLSPEVFDVLKRSMDSTEPIKDLMETTLNLLIEAEFDAKIGAKRYEHTTSRATSEGQKIYRCGYRHRRFDTTAGTLTLRIPHPKKGGYIPSFLKRYQRYEEALKQTIIDAYASGVSMGRMNNLVKSMGIKGISKGQVSAIIGEVNDTVEEFRHRRLNNLDYPVIFVDAMFEKAFVEGHSTHIGIIVVSGLRASYEREVLAIEAYPDESKESYLKLFKSLKTRGLRCPKLIVSDGAAGLFFAKAEVFPKAKWQRCKVHLVRKVLSKVTTKADRKKIGNELKEIWHTKHKSKARKRAMRIFSKYLKTYPKAMAALKWGLEDTLTFMDFPEYSPKKISTSNVLERLNKEFRRRSKSIGVFPNVEACLRLFTLFVMHYTDKWHTSVNAIEVSPCVAISLTLNTPLPPQRGFKRQPRNAPALA